MTEIIYGLMVLAGVFIFIGGIIFLTRRAKSKRQAILRQELDGLFPMFKLYFEDSQIQSKKLTSEPLLVLKRRISDWMILVFFLIIFILVALFYENQGKPALLIGLALVILFCLIRSSSYVTVYEQALVHGNLLRKKVIWFDSVDAIEARLYDYGNVKHIDVMKDYSRIYRVYELKRKNKVIYEIHETEFKKARAVETCFTIKNPLIKQICESSI